MNDPVKMAQELKRMQDNLKTPLIVEYINHVANEKFAKYQSYIRAGFDPRQALELVIREGQK